MRIYVTGIGVVSPLAIGAKATMDALLRGDRGVGPVSLFDPTGCRSGLAAEVPGLSVGDVAPAGAATTWSRTDAMAVLAAKEALTEARLAPGRDAVDLIVGGTTAGMYETEELLAEMHRDPSARKPLEKMLSHPLSATADRLCEAAGPFRRARTLCSACSSGANALLLAASWLRTGRADRVLAGGADGLCRLTYTGFSCLGALSPDPCRPFDARRDGLNLGEGAAFLVVETEASVVARGVTPLGELRGWAVGAEAHHITNPQPTGETAARVMGAALARAELAPSDIGYVNAHGTATKLNDRMESAALRRCFGEALGDVAVSSSKGQLGHTLGAAGAVEAAVVTMALARGVFPPTAGLEEVDPDCADLRHLTTATKLPVRAAMSNSFGFGGSDAVVVLTAVDAFDAPSEVTPGRVFITSAGTVGALGVGAFDAAREYLRPGDAPAGDTAFDAAEHLELARARRIDKAGRMAATAMKAALGAADVREADLSRAGAIAGTAFGSVDHCSAFIHRIYEKGARFASPAVFPNLLPSSPVAHASIYHRLGGPVFSSADLGATAEAAVVTAGELVMAGEADWILAGGIEEESPITEAVLEPLCAAPVEGPRSEGTVVAMVESAASAHARGARPLAELAWSADWRGEDPPSLRLPAPIDRARARVVVAHDDARAEALLADSPWADVVRVSAAPRAGGHEAAGGFGLAAALGELAAGAWSDALVLGLARDRGFALHLTANEDAGR